MSAATMNEMERLRRERDEAIAERDALAAHVERIHSLANVANLMEADDVCNQLVDIDDESPAHSLARLKAEWQAEAYDFSARLAKLMGADKEISAFLESIASDLRRQSQEGGDGHN